MAVAIGTSGWHYPHWTNVFYPKGLPATSWLRYYADRFKTVELNNAFYRLPDRATFEGWRESLPAGFVVSVKASRYLTHVKRLKDPAEPVARLLDRAAGLGDRLGPFLLQLPPNLRLDLHALESTLMAFGSAKVAVELRNETWFVDEVEDLLAANGAALCWADGGAVKVPRWRTAPWGYVRFHAGTGRPRSCYSRSAITTRAGWIAEAWSPREAVYCYFNNDANGCALRDAGLLARALSKRGLSATQVPSGREVHLRRS